MASRCCPTQPLRVTRWHQGSRPRALETEYLDRLPPVPPPTETAPCRPFLVQRDVWFLKSFASLFFCYCPCSSFIQAGRGFLGTRGRQRFGERGGAQNPTTTGHGARGRGAPQAPGSQDPCQPLPPPPPLLRGGPPCARRALGAGPWVRKAVSGVSSPVTAGDEAQHAAGLGRDNGSFDK